MYKIETLILFDYYIEPHSIYCSGLCTIYNIRVNERII